MKISFYNAEQLESSAIFPVFSKGLFWFLIFSLFSFSLWFYRAPEINQQARLAARENRDRSPSPSTRESRSKNEKSKSNGRRSYGGESSTSTRGDSRPDPNRRRSLGDVRHTEEGLLKSHVLANDEVRRPWKPNWGSFSQSGSDRSTDDETRSNRSSSPANKSRWEDDDSSNTDQTWKETTSHADRPWTASSDNFDQPTEESSTLVSRARQTSLETIGTPRTDTSENVNRPWKDASVIHTSQVSDSFFHSPRSSLSSERTSCFSTVCAARTAIVTWAAEDSNPVSSPVLTPSMRGDQYPGAQIPRQTRKTRSKHRWWEIYKFWFFIEFPTGTISSGTASGQSRKTRSKHRESVWWEIFKFRFFNEFRTGSMSSGTSPGQSGKTRSNHKESVWWEIFKFCFFNKFFNGSISSGTTAGQSWKTRSKRCESVWWEICKLRSFNDSRSGSVSCGTTPGQSRKTCWKRRESVWWEIYKFWFFSEFRASSISTATTPDGVNKRVSRYAVGCLHKSGCTKQKRQHE